MPDSGLEDLRDVVSIAPGDFDNDGLPDLCVVTTHGAALYRNVNGKFRKHADLAAGSFRQAVWLDYDHDYDLDLFLIGDDSKLLRNNGQAGFSDETSRFPFVAGPRARRRALRPRARYARLRPRGLLPGPPGRPLSRPPRGELRGSGSEGAARGLDASACQGFQPRWPHRSGGRAAACSAESPRWISEVLRREPAAPPWPPISRATAASTALASSDGALTIDRDVTPDYGNWIEIALTGVKNLKSRIGAKVEVKAGTSYEKQTYAGLPLVFRLGSRTQVDTVRITWPNGLIQNEMNQPVNKLVDHQGSASASPDRAP